MKLEKVFLRTEFNYDRDAASDESALVCKDVSRARQSMRDETDINRIVERFGLTGKLPDVKQLQPLYGDFTSVTDFHTAANMVIEADLAFEKLPPAVRARFHNDPGALIDFVADPGNRGEAEKLGLVPKRPQEPPTVIPGTPPQAATPGAPGGAPGKPETPPAS